MKFISLHIVLHGENQILGFLIFTEPLRTLMINFVTSAAGYSKVEIQDPSGRAIAGYRLKEADEIIGDEIKRIVSWKDNTDVSKLAEIPIRLRFVMKDADLYSMKFKH